MLFIPDYLPKYLILPISVLNCIEADFPINHPEIRPKILAQSIIPILKCTTRPSWSIISRISCAFFGKSIVKLVLRPEPSIKFIFKGVHELPILEALELVVVQLIIVNKSKLSVMRLEIIVIV